MTKFPKKNLCIYRHFLIRETPKMCFFNQAVSLMKLSDKRNTNICFSYQMSLYKENYIYLTLNFFNFCDIRLFLL